MARSARSTTMPSVGGTRSEVGISAAATAIKLDRLAHKRRDKNKNSAKETVRRAQILQLTPLLSQVPLGTLRQIAAKMEEVEVQDGHFLFHEGDIGDFMYVVQSGALGVYVESRGKVKDILPGETCGELALIINEGRSASVKVHGITALLRLEIKQAQTYLNKIWGGQKELERRTKLLLRIPVFQYLPRDELHVLSTRMTRVTYAEPGMDIVTEGKIGDCMYLIERGSAMVWVQKVGRLNELKLNDYFGELAVLHHLPRTATVRTTEECVCLCLKQKDVLRLLDSDAMAPESREALQKGFDHYGHRQALRSSELVKSSILEFWELMVELSSKLVSGASSASASTGRSNASNKWEMLRRATGMGFVNREGYTQMHLRVSKVLQHNFTFDDGVDSATVDWAEDITAFSGDSKVDIWLEEVKKKLKDATFTTVHAMGWQSLFAKYDEDESGSIDLTEFKLAARNDLNMAEELFSEEHLCSLFAAMDDDGGGAVEYTEFSAWMSETDFSRPASYLSTLEKAKREELGEELWDAMAMLQIGCREHVDRIGWKALFAKYDDSYGDDADGQLDLEEFTEILRKECNISDDAVPDETLIDLFEAVDTDGAGGIDAEEFEDFICSDPLAMDMTYKVFAEAMFQLAQLWVEEEDEEQYAAFLDALFDRITKIANMDEETYELRELDEIHTFANEDGSIAVEGVKTKNPFAPDYPEHRDSDLDRQQMATTVTEGFDLSSSRADRTRGSGERNSAPGPWTEKEVSHLLQLVEEHGSGKWNEKAEQLKTGRTGAQVSTKYFAVMNEKREVERREKERHIKGLEAEGSSSVATTKKWTDEEVIRLVDLVTKMGLENWKAVAAELGTGRTGGQVQQKYFVVTNPGVEQEDPEGLDATEKKHLEDEDKELATVARKRKVTVAELKETIAPADREQIRRDLLDRRSHSMGNLREMRARASPQAIVAGLGAQQAASVVAPVPLAAVERPAESPISPRKRVSPKPVGWFQAPELGNRDKVTWKDKKSALPEKSSKVPTVAMQMRLLARVSKRGKSKREASSRPEAAASQTATNKTGLKVAVHPTPCVNWAATEGQTDTSLFFSPFATGHAGAQSARPHTTGSSLRSGQRLLPQQPHTARPVVPGGGGRLVAARRQPLADASAFLPPERRRPTPLDVLNGAGDGDSEQSSARTKLQTPPGLR
jgi:CRP-like cAMP-binding protein/Ca2+-binding EF-hand superfamily protein